MNPVAEHLATLLELDARHDELLERLAELDDRLGKVLAQWSPARPEAAGHAPASAAGPGAPTC